MSTIPSPKHFKPQAINPRASNPKRRKAKVQVQRDPAAHRDATTLLARLRGFKAPGVRAASAKATLQKKPASTTLKLTRPTSLRVVKSESTCTSNPAMVEVRVVIDAIEDY